MKNKVYHTSPPFEVPNTGDYDYGTAIIRLLKQQELEVEYLTLREAIVIPDIKETVNKLRRGVDELKTDDFINEFESWKQDSTRIEAIDQIKYYILKDSENNYHPMLNLQLRPPDTGFAFVPEDIEDFKKSGIQVNITCHEYQLNGIDRVYYQAVLHHYFKASDTVTFFNLSDFTNASKHANHVTFDFGSLPIERQVEWQEYGEGQFKVWRDHFTHPPYNLADKVIMSRVPPTVGYKTTNFEQFIKRKPYIVLFGSIRTKKGIKETLDLVQEIKKINIQAEEKIRVKILGAPFGDKGCKAMIDLVKARFEQKVIEAALGSGGIRNLRKHLNSKVDVNEKGEEYINNINILNTVLQNLLGKESAGGYLEKAPIDIHIGLPDEKVVEICHKAKYAVKFDNKGWANNASAHITPLVNGCILYTGCGVNTSKEVLKGGKYQDAVVFLGNKYSLKKGKKLTVKQKKDGKQQVFFKLKDEVPNDDKDEDSDKELITSEMVLKDILARENDPSLNQHTFNKAQQLSQEFTTILGKEFKEALTSQEERYKQYHKPSIQEKLIKLETQRLLALLKQDNNRGLSNILKELKGKSINSYQAAKQVEEFLLNIVSRLIQENATVDRSKIYDFTSIKNFMLQDLWLQSYNEAGILKLDINYLSQISSSFEFYKLMKQRFEYLSGSSAVPKKWFLDILALFPQFNVIYIPVLENVQLNEESINQASIVSGENISNIAAQEQRTEYISNQSPLILTQFQSSIIQPYNDDKDYYDVPIEEANILDDCSDIELRNDLSNNEGEHISTSSSLS